ncbi:MAG TPA: M28 family peptidase, partial [Verrucomicrobiales bacterium]|nr:M28 family peptidase [Verrucomicrobiales bacterium]
ALPGRITATVKGLQSTLGGSNMGFKPSQQVYKAGGVDCYNLVVEIPARSPERAGEIVIAGAHYDSAPGSPGADANASGVSACIALCQAFANTQQERTLRIVFFANGESSAVPPEESGSVAYARECKLRGEKVVAMLSLSSLGYYSTAKDSQKSPPGLTPPLPDTGNFLAVFGRSTGKPLVDTFQSVMSRNSTLPVAAAVLPDTLTLSLPGDDAAFTQEGFPAVLVTDTASLRNPNTHQPGDLPDTLDYERFTQAVQGIEGVLQALANPSRSGEK